MIHLWFSSELNRYFIARNKCAAVLASQNYFDLLQSKIQTWANFAENTREASFLTYKSFQSVSIVSINAGRLKSDILYIGVSNFFNVKFPFSLTDHPRKRRTEWLIYLRNNIIWCIDHIVVECWHSTVKLNFL